MLTRKEKADMHYLFDIDFEEGLGSCNKPRTIGDYNFQLGMPITTGDVPNPLVCPTDHVGPEDFADYLNNQLPVVSRRFVQALRDAGVSNFEEYPADILNRDTGQRWTGFVAINIIGSLKCVHVEASSGSDIGGNCIIYHDITLRKEVINNHLLFRVDEACATIVIHESVKRHLASVSPKLTGINFIPVKEA